MKNYKNTFLKYTAALMFVLALVMPNNMDASDSRSNGSQDSKSSESEESSEDSGSSESQDSGSSDGSSDGGSNDSIPLDGGLGILILGAAAFGIKKLRGNKEDK
jgi:hypothetical protein